MEALDVDPAVLEEHGKVLVLRVARADAHVFLSALVRHWVAVLPASGFEQVEQVVLSPRPLRVRCPCLLRLLLLCRQVGYSRKLHERDLAQFLRGREHPRRAMRALVGRVALPCHGAVCLDDPRRVVDLAVDVDGGRIKLVGERFEASPDHVPAKLVVGQVDGIKQMKSVSRIAHDWVCPALLAQPVAHLDCQLLRGGFLLVRGTDPGWSLRVDVHQHPFAPGDVRVVGRELRPVLELVAWRVPATPG